MTNEINWREDYLSRKAGLSYLQIKLLKEGPHQLTDSWFLNAMYNDWKRLTGIPPEPERPNLQSSFKEWNGGISNDL